MRLQSSLGKTAARSCALAALMTMAAYSSTAHALTLGHSVLLSAPGAPLLVTVPVRDLTPAQQDSLRVMIPDETAWAQASLTPPVSLASLRVYLEPGHQPGTRLIRVVSDQPFTGSVADILLDVQTSAGQRRHQVTLLPHADAHIARVASSSLYRPADQAGANKPSGAVVQPGHTITVRRGDTLFSIARRYAIDGITEFQFLAALYQANPHAFSQRNMNLLRAGTVLSVPDMPALTALTDRQARQFFMQHLSAFNAYRAGKARSAGVIASVSLDSSAQEAASGTLSTVTEHTSAPSSAASGDRLLLSSAAAAEPVSSTLSQAGVTPKNGEPGTPLAGLATDQQVAQQRAVQEAQSRVSALEANVRDLQQLQQQAQGETSSSSSNSSTTAVQASESMSLGEQRAGPSSAQATATSGEASASNTTAAMSSATVSPNAQAPVSLTEKAPSAASSAIVSNATGGSSDGSESGIRSSISPAVLSGQVSQTTEHAFSWMKDRMVWVMSGVLVFVVLLVAWFVRQRKSAGGNVSGQTVITEAMIREKLQHVDLNLDSDTSSKGKL